MICRKTRGSGWHWVETPAIASIGFHTLSGSNVLISPRLKKVARVMDEASGLIRAGRHYFFSWRVSSKFSITATITNKVYVVATNGSPSSSSVGDAAARFCAVQRDGTRILQRSITPRLLDFIRLDDIRHRRLLLTVFMSAGMKKATSRGPWQSAAHSQVHTPLSWS